MSYPPTERPAKESETPGYVQIQTAARRIEEIINALSSLEAAINSAPMNKSTDQEATPHKSLMAVLRETSGEINKDVDSALTQIQALSDNLLT